MNKIDLAKIAREEGLPLYLYADGTLSGTLYLDKPQICIISSLPQEDNPEPFDVSGVKVGWYAFTNGKFSPDFTAYPQIKGIVVWTNPDHRAPIGRRGLIMLTESSNQCWAGNVVKTGICDQDNGWLNTQKLAEYADNYQVRFPAVEWCRNYSRNGVKKGSAFIPAINQLMQIYENIRLIRAAYRNIGLWPYNSSIVSSTEAERYSDCILGVTYVGSMVIKSKAANLAVMAVVAY